MKVFFILLIILAAQQTGVAAGPLPQLLSVNAAADTTKLPDVIQQLDRPGNKGIRSYSGAHRYKSTYQTPDGTTLYYFSTEASIGCNRNEPASSKYYNDSGKLVASFPRQFSMKQAFKPFIAPGYKPADFSESAKGEYPEYFAMKATLLEEKKKAPADPFPQERSFTITAVLDNSLPFKAGELLKIHTKTGLWYFPKKGSHVQYKIIPQLSVRKSQTQCRVPPCPVIETKELVYFMATAQRFIRIANNQFFISTTKYPDANTPAKAIEIKWKTAFELKAD
ncbi:MAG: hypothetical protein EOO04_26840 [Chitinophagaceae bacterium]|nr:MAG: hypothetical protein EOO04_26840 [Chitinophagaceae bacterium]